jgi:hypothetical protein
MANKQPEITDEARAILADRKKAKPQPELPKGIGADELIEMDIPRPGTIIDGRLPSAGAVLVVGAQKSNKTLLSLQLSFAMALDHPLFDWFARDGAPANVLFVEKDDPAAEGSVQDVLKVSPVIKAAREKGAPIPFTLFPTIKLTFGPAFVEWLRLEIGKTNARLVVLDSYTALRPARSSGGDIVKTEYYEVGQLDELGKQTETLILVIHHDSKAAANLHWTQRGGGSYGLTAATEGQIYISRFADLMGDAPERLVQIRGRHVPDTEFVLRFRKETLDHELLFEGPAAPHYPLIQGIKIEFRDGEFSAKDLQQAIGVGRSQAYRYLHRLNHAGALVKVGNGHYKLDSKVR